MRSFLEWFEALCEDRRRTIPPEILRGYDFALRRELQQIAQGIEDPSNRSRFMTLIDCPIIDSSGACRSFADYVLGALIRNGVHPRYDLEQSLQYVFEKMLVRNSVGGETRNTLFTNFDPDQPDSAAHFRARFKTWVKYLVANIRAGKIARLTDTEQRPQGTVSISQGRRKEGDLGGAISPDQIAARPSGDAHFQELIEDIKSLLRRKEAAYELPLVRFFSSMMSGARTAQQYQQFGDRPMRAMRSILKQTVQDYAEKTGNYMLLQMLKRYEDYQGNKPMPQARKPVQVVKPVLSDQQRDYASILLVLDKLSRPAGTAHLGSARRRWLEYPPRDPGSGHRNRLEEVLARMVQDGVLTATRTGQGAFVYSPGPNAHAYRQGSSTV
jgi:hypothetical protein